jgi:hypothetical protein
VLSLSDGKNGDEAIEATVATLSNLEVLAEKENFRLPKNFTIQFHTWLFETGLESNEEAISSFKQFFLRG